ncbi:5'-nucleotidase C-terminal domain-containing protein [soil metagenome]
MRLTLPQRRRRPTILLAGLVIAALLVPFGANAARPFPAVTIQILDISDWHAQLDPVIVDGQPVGGAAVLSAYFQQHRAANPNTLTVTAGDDFGASPPLSDFFDEVPAILAQRLMGIDVGTFGNHNFDRGVDHLQEMIDLAGSSSASVPGDPFTYVSANLQNRDNELDGVEDYRIFDVAGTKVAVIGLTNPEAPTLVFPGSFGTITPTDPVAAAMRAQKAARKAGADVMVVITHMGITDRDTATGPLTDFANAVRGFDVIIGDHTDFQFEATINGALVIENRSKGLTYSATELVVEQRPGKGNHRVLSKSNAFYTPFASAVTPDPAVEEMLAPYRAEIAPILAQVLGSSQVAIPRGDACGRSDGRLCESLIGNVVTDAMRLRYGTDFAITNAGGIRADLTCPTVDLATDSCEPFTPPPYPITRGQTLAVLPFGNIVVTATLTGAELKAALEVGVSAMPGANGRFAQVSGLCFTYDVAQPAGSRVTTVVRQAADGSCTGPAVDLTAASTYTIAENDFMVAGGDGYPNLIARSVSREIMEQVVAEYVMSESPLSPTIQGRIVCTSTGAAVCPVPVP